MFCAFASESASAQPLGPHMLLASIAKAAQVLLKFATTLQSLPLHCARARIAAASAETSFDEYPNAPQRPVASAPAAAAAAAEAARIASAAKHAARDAKRMKPPQPRGAEGRQKNLSGAKRRAPRARS